MLVRHFEFAKLATILVLLRIRNTRMLKYEEMKKKISCLIMCAVTCAALAQTTGDEAGHTWIDLGLPSGVKWASTNVGANRPQDDGDYYAWGETTVKTDFRWATYSHGTGQNSLTKYSNSDELLSLEAADDVAFKAWGGTWRMPTKEEWGELQEHCVWTWTDDYNETGAAGYVVASKSGGASLFLPAAGCRYANLINEKGVHGYYWSSSLFKSSSYSGSAYQLQFIRAYVKSDWNHTRYYGSSVRGVCNVPSSTIEGITQSECRISVIGGKIHCGQEFRVYDLYGRDVTHQNGSLPKGVYVVQTENGREKVGVF